MGAAVEVGVLIAVLIAGGIAGLVWGLKPLWPRVANYIRAMQQRDLVEEEEARLLEEGRAQAEKELEEPPVRQDH